VRRMRKRGAEAPENHERWLVSYADFITLLFAFFVVMYSVSSVNDGKYKILSQTLDGVFNATQRAVQPIQIGEESATQPHSDVPNLLPFEQPDRDEGTTRHSDEEGRLRDISRRFESKLKTLIGKGLVTVEVTDEWIELSLRNNLLFTSGDALPVDAAFTLIDSISEILKDYPNAIVVEGFTDNIPIRSDVYPSNWELSAARAAAMARLLIMGGVGPQQVAAVGYGEYQPLADNSTTAGRARNRRVVILVARSDKVRQFIRRVPAE